MGVGVGAGVLSARAWRLIRREERALPHPLSLSTKNIHVIELFTRVHDEKIGLK